MELITLAIAAPLLMIYNRKLHKGAEQKYPRIRR